MTKDVVDIWVNLLPPESARQYLGDANLDGVQRLFGTDVSSGTGAEETLALMEECGVGMSVLTPGLSAGTEDFLAIAEKFPDRFLVAAMVDRAGKPVLNCKRIRELAENPLFSMVRVGPLVEQYPLNHALYYPVYATCEELAIPVGINVGIPGPPVRSRCQDPVLLEDLLIDFPDLVVIGAHMGHPYEPLLIQYMMKWPNLYLSNTAYLAKYMDEGLVRFMSSSRGIGRVLYGSDHPFLPMTRALEAARSLPLSDEAMAAYLGGTARRLLVRATPSAA
jgi:uncharacterized protein